MSLDYVLEEKQSSSRAAPAGRDRPRVIVYDVDPGNPYGRELAALLASTCEVDALVPVDTEWAPAGLSVRRILPAHRPAGIARQLFRQMRGLAAVGRAASIGRASVIVVMTRSWYDQIVLALFSALGARMIVIAHDPAPKAPLPKHLALSQWMLWRSRERSLPIRRNSP